MNLDLLRDEDGNILAKNHTLPIVSLEIDEKYLWSEDSGLFVVGTNGIEGSDGKVANYNQKWEFPARATYIINEDTSFFDRVGFRIKGHYSRRKSNKSIALYWREKYEKKTLKRKLFEDRETDRFKVLKLRTGGSDQGTRMIADMVLSRWLHGHVDLDMAAGRPAVLYINGAYWGLYNIREHINPNFFETYHGVDDDNVDYLSGGPALPGVDNGSKEQFVKEVLTFIRNQDLTLDENYRAFWSLMDLHNFIDYYIVETYIANWDWPLNNTKWWREASTAGYETWRFTIVDLDAAFLPQNKEYFWLGEFYQHTEGEIETYKHGFYLFDPVMKNRTFRIQFFKRYLYMIDHVFDQERLESVIDELTGEMKREYDRHETRWRQYPDFPEWKANVDKMKAFNTYRQEYVRPLIVKWLEEAENE